MKKEYMTYERPDLEEVELELEGSFLDSATSAGKEDTDGSDDEWG